MPPPTCPKPIPWLVLLGSAAVAFVLIKKKPKSKSS